MVEAGESEFGPFLTTRNLLNSLVDRNPQNRRFA
jgi:hypothetical protein